MKKTIGCLLTLLVVFFLFACGQESSLSGSVFSADEAAESFQPYAFVRPPHVRVARIVCYQDAHLLDLRHTHATDAVIEKIVFDESVNEVYIGETLDLSFSLLPENAPNEGILATSSKPEIAEVSLDESGESLICVMGRAAGKATITITAPSGVKITRIITVKERVPTKITLINTEPETKIEVGTPISLDIAWEPEDTSLKTLSWLSSNNKVIKVNTDGTLEAVGVGTAKITAKHKSGRSGTITLTVEPTPVSQIKLTTDLDQGKDFVKGDRFTIVADFLPQNATNRTLKYSSSDNKVATVTNKGVVTAVDVGTATITVVSPEGPTGQIEVKVAPGPQKFKITWSASLLDSNHVGNNWSKSFEVNGEPFASGALITVSPESTLSVCLCVVETDRHPDRGSCSRQLSYSDDLWKTGCEISEMVYVREDGGRYAGNSAVWSVLIRIKPVK